MKIATAHVQQEMRQMKIFMTKKSTKHKKAEMQELKNYTAYRKEVTK